MSVSHQWFYQWGPPANLFSNSPLQHPLPTSPLQSGQTQPFSPPPDSPFLQYYRDDGVPHDPYRGYSYDDSSRYNDGYISPETGNHQEHPRVHVGRLPDGRVIHDGLQSSYRSAPRIIPEGYPFSAPRAPVLPGSTEVAGPLEDPFSGQNLPQFGPGVGLFQPWKEGQEIKESQRNNNAATSMIRLLPALLVAGGAGGMGRAGGAGGRGDQEPPEDPDRDLGGPSPLRTLYHWNLLDYEFENEAMRQAAINTKDFIPENNLPLGMEAWKGRVFVTVPRWKPGVPCTLATVPRAPTASVVSPKLKPYPDWSYHRKKQGDCSGLTSVFRLNADRCGRLWVLDSGQVEALSVPRQVCPPQLVAFDLNTDREVGRWPIPPEHVRQNSLFTNILADIRDDKCDDVHVYFTDVWRFSILVFRLRDEKFWRFNSHLFYPDPMASDYTVNGINFQWSDGVFGISLTPVDKRGERTLYFHPMSGIREFKVPTSILRNQTATTDTELLARVITVAGETRGRGGQSSASAISRNGVMFFNLVTRDALGCWDTRKPYKKSALGVVAQDSERLIFPNDLKIDSEPRQSVWVLSNKLPVFLYRKLDPNDINFRIMREFADEAIAGSVCDPLLPLLGSHKLEPECY